MAVVTAVELVQDEELQPASSMCRVVITGSPLKRGKLKDAEELDDLLIHALVGRRTCWRCGLYVELSCLLLKGVDRQLGFKWLVGVDSGAGRFVVCVAPVFQDEVDVDEVCVCVCMASMILPCMCCLWA